MRDFVDAILAVIGAASLNDDEFELVESTSQTYTLALYTEVLLVLDSRESVSNVRDRLGYYFQARGVAITAPAVAGGSKILIGDGLWNCD